MQVGLQAPHTSPCAPQRLWQQPVEQQRMHAAMCQVPGVGPLAAAAIAASATSLAQLSANLAEVLTLPAVRGQAAQALDTLLHGKEPEAPLLAM